ncbi:MAG: preprotein translocase subunit SecE [Actinobacteria bacterium]|nr:MAG: preprotein translocase subunit SecE [Actinomycetota bacterium]
MAKAATADAKPAKPAKASKPSKAQGKPNVFVRFVRYLKDVRAEMRRVVWPTRAEVGNSSVVVVTTLAIFIVVIFAFDQVILRIVQMLDKVVK